MKKAALSLFLLIASLAQASDYQTDPLSIIQERVCIISTFEERDFFTVYSSTGTPLWEIPFASKIISWKIDGDHLYTFSKTRTGKIYFLSCFDIQKGELLWEKPIFAPPTETDEPTMEPTAEAAP